MREHAAIRSSFRSASDPVGAPFPDRNAPVVRFSIELDTESAHDDCDGDAPYERNQPRRARR